MNAIRFIFIGLFLFAFSLKSTGQSLSVDFSYDKSTRSFEVEFTNNTEKPIGIKNFQLEEGNVSYIRYFEKTPKGTVERSKVLLWDERNNWISDFRHILPLKTMHLSRPIYDSSRPNKIKKAILKLEFLAWDSAAGKYAFQEYEKEILINE